MTYPWNDNPEFDAQMEFTGWPECTLDGVRYWLKCGVYGDWWHYKGNNEKDWFSYHAIHPYIAACLIREWRREWLEAREAVVFRHRGKYRVWVGLDWIGDFDTYDAAQNAAIAAVMKEQGDG